MGLRSFLLILPALAAIPYHAPAQGNTPGANPPLIATPVQAAFSMVVLPKLPAAMDFAGERVPLENYDTRESLERELCGTIYMHSRTLSSLLNMTRYFPVIEPILARNGIPADFKYLCLAESGLNPNISSGVGAAGLWQLMPALGKSCGLEVGPQIDERYHIEKATQTACDYLRDSYKRFGSWTMAAASYNLGNAGLAKRAEKQRINNYYDLFLPEETLRYVHRILAWKLVAENPALYGFIIPADSYHQPLDNYREVETDSQKIDWAAFALQHNTSYKMLRELNHWIRDYDCANPSQRTYKVKIPGRRFRE